MSVPLGIRNRILATLPLAELSTIRPHLKPVNLRRNEVLYESGAPVRWLYFPEEAVLAITVLVESGSVSEVGVVGHKGMVGIRVFLGARTTPHRVHVLIPGRALRIDAAALREACVSCTVLRNRLLTYTQVLLVELRQMSACNSLHAMKGRLCSWLLRLHDRAVTDKLPVTQETMASMLGVRRSGVNVAINELERAGLLAHGRGWVSILDYEGLEAAACECYHVIKKEIARIGDPSSSDNSPAMRQPA